MADESVGWAWWRRLRGRRRQATAAVLRQRPPRAGLSTLALALSLLATVATVATVAQQQAPTIVLFDALLPGFSAPAPGLNERTFAAAGGGPWVGPWSNVGGVAVAESGATAPPTTPTPTAAEDSDDDREDLSAAAAAGPQTNDRDGAVMLYAGSSPAAPDHPSTAAALLSASEPKSAPPVFTAADGVAFSRAVELFLAPTTLPGEPSPANVTLLDVRQQHEEERGGARVSASVELVAGAAPGMAAYLAAALQSDPALVFPTAQWGAASVPRVEVAVAASAPRSPAAPAEPRPPSEAETQQQPGLYYSWRAGDYGPCPVLCGGGVQRRAVECVSTGGGSQAADPALCAGLPPPLQDERACNARPCEAIGPRASEWAARGALELQEQGEALAAAKAAAAAGVGNATAAATTTASLELGPWGDCLPLSFSCVGDRPGSRRRGVRLRSSATCRLAAGGAFVADLSACFPRDARALAPLLWERCDTTPPCKDRDRYHWRYGEWSACAGGTEEKGGGVSTRPAACVRASDGAAAAPRLCEPSVGKAANVTRPCQPAPFRAYYWRPREQGDCELAADGSAVAAVMPLAPPRADEAAAKVAAAASAAGAMAAVVVAADDDGLVPSSVAAADNSSALPLVSRRRALLADTDEPVPLGWPGAWASDDGNGEDGGTLPPAPPPAPLVVPVSDDARVDLPEPLLLPATVTTAASSADEGVTATAASPSSSPASPAANDPSLRCAKRVAWRRFDCAEVGAPPDSPPVAASLCAGEPRPRAELAEAECLLPADCAAADDGDDDGDDDKSGIEEAPRRSSLAVAARAASSTAVSAAAAAGVLASGSATVPDRSVLPTTTLLAERDGGGGGNQASSNASLILLDSASGLSILDDAVARSSPAAADVAAAAVLRAAGVDAASSLQLLLVESTSSCGRGGAPISANGTCCSSGDAIDANGTCCDGGRGVDACGVCGGDGSTIDALGACCGGEAGRLDARGLCCPAGAQIDECGVCGGGSECALRVRLGVSLGQTAVAAGTGQERRRLLRSRIEELIAAALRGAKGPFGFPAGREAFGALGMPWLRREQVAVVGEEQEDAEDGAASVVVEVAVTAQTKNNNVTSPQIPSTARALLLLRSLEGARLELEGSGDQGDDASIGPVLAVTRAGVCGDGVCQVNERPAPGNPRSCHEDCPFPYLTCPPFLPPPQNGGSSSGGGGSGTAPPSPPRPSPCNGVGTCHTALGACACFRGYAGPDCGRCALGYKRVSHAGAVGGWSCVSARALLMLACAQGRCASSSPPGGGNGLDRSLTSAAALAPVLVPGSAATQQQQRAGVLGVFGSAFALAALGALALHRRQRRRRARQREAYLQGLAQAVED
jgi:hypothetical protein